MKTNDVDNYKYAPVKSDEMWKIDIVKELVEVRANQVQIEHFSEEEVNELIEHICTS